MFSHLMAMNFLQLEKRVLNTFELSYNLFLVLYNNNYQVIKKE